MYVHRAESIKKAERFVTRERGATFYSLMDVAGRKCADFIAGRTDKSACVTVLCGKGKNGGDGLVIARRLWKMGFYNTAAVLVCGEITEPLAYKMYTSLVRYPVPVFDYTENPVGALNRITASGVIVDAIFGIGFKGKLTGNAADAVTTANLNENAVKFAVDIPSGLEADSCAVPELYFRTDYTLTMIAFKPVQVNKPSALCCGDVRIMRLGVDAEDLAPFSEDYEVLTRGEALAAVKKRNYDANKGDFGRVLIIAGRKDMTGCVGLCSRAAVEIGAGLVTVAFPDAAYCAVAPKMAEQTMLLLPSDTDGGISAEASDIIKKKLPAFSAVACGCGTGTDPGAVSLVLSLLAECRVPLVLDADALNCLAGRADELKKAECDVIITPHPGEMARLTGLTAEEINRGRRKIASDFAREYGVTVVLKGADTVTASPDGRVRVNPTGNPGMARGGSGDVLTGIIAGLIPQTEDVFTAASVGAYIHGGAGDFTARGYGVLSVTPSRLTDNIHCYINESY